MNLNHRPATGRTLLGALTLLAFCSSTGFAMTADELAREKQHQLQLSQLDALDMQALQSADDGIRISDPIMERLMDSGLSGEALKQAYQTEWDLQRILADEAARMTQTVSPAVDAREHARIKLENDLLWQSRPHTSSNREVPVNNACAEAIVIGEGVFPYTTVEATREAPASICDTYDSNAPDIWFSYTPNCSGTATFSLCGADFDTQLYIWDGCGGSIIACNDDFGCESGDGLQSQLSMAVTFTTTYLVQVTGYNANTGSGDLAVSMVCDAPTNDTCATAIAIGPGRTPFYTTAATHTATLSCGLTDSSPDAWFSWTALCDATVTLSTCGDANYDTVLGMWDACGGTLISCIDDNCSNLKSYIAFSATGGSTYYFEVSGYLGAFGHGGLTLTVAPPANDTCASATPISGAGTHDYCTQYATHTADNCVSTAGDVWYMYTADCASLVTFTTCDANPSYDTAIALWDACDGTMLDCNDDWFDGMNYPCNVDSRIDRYMLQGEQVLVQMGGFLSSNGQSTLTVSTICYDPPNDLCALALPLGEGVTAFTNVGAETDGPDEATLCNNANDTNVGADVWYTYSSVTSGVVTIDLSGSLYDTKIAVYQGLCPSMESAIACDDDGGSGLTSLVTFGACADQQYLIRIGGFTPSTGIPRTGTGTMDVSLAPVDTPMNPQNLQIEILDDSVLLNWAPVLENVLGCPMAASSYDVYSTDADGNEALVASTPLTSVVLPYENVDDTVRSYRVVALSAASWRTAPVAFTGNTVIDASNQTEK